MHIPAKDLHHRSDILPQESQEEVDVVRVELFQQRVAAHNKRWGVQRVSRLLGHHATWQHRFIHRLGSTGSVGFLDTMPPVNTDSYIDRVLLGQ